MRQAGMGPGGPLEEGDKRRWILKLLSQIRCVECGQLYNPHDFTVVHRRKDLWVLSTRCQNCTQPCHVVIYMRPEAEPELVTDLTPEELKVADQWSPITTDDVLDMHALLSEFEGDFEELLQS